MSLSASGEQRPPWFSIGTTVALAGPFLANWLLKRAGIYFFWTADPVFQLLYATPPVLLTVWHLLKPSMGRMRWLSAGVVAPYAYSLYRTLSPGDTGPLWFGLAVALSVGTWGFGLCNRRGEDAFTWLRRS